MSFYDLQPGEPLQSSRLMNNFRHFNGRGTPLLPQDSNGNLITNKSINIGSNANQFGDVYCGRVIQSSPLATVGA